MLIQTTSGAGADREMVRPPERVERISVNGTVVWEKGQDWPDPAPRLREGDWISVWSVAS